MSKTNYNITQLNQRLCLLGHHVILIIVCDNSVLLNNVRIPRRGTHKCLGVETDEKLNWDKHIETICKKVSAGIGAIRRAKPFDPANTLQTIYKAMVQPYFDYCSPLWDNCGKLLKDKLQKVQSRAARVITRASYNIRFLTSSRGKHWN